MNREVDWIRNQATDSQIEGILSQRDRLINKVAFLNRIIYHLGRLSARRKDPDGNKPQNNPSNR